MAIKLIIRRQGTGAGVPPLAERVYAEPIVTIGSDPAATLSFEDPAIAPEQAAIITGEDGEMLFINRAEGTRLNDELLAREARRPLADGDIFYIGSYAISLQTNAGASSVAAVATSRQQQPRTRANSPSETNEARQTPDAGRRTPDAPASSSPASTPNAASPLSRKGGGGGFGTLLDSLLTEEDRFYFEIVSAVNGRSRVVIEGAEMLIGWDATGQQISCNAVAILAPRALVRKDLGGVLVEPQSPGTISVNGEAIESARRLRDGDRLTLLPTPVTVDAENHSLVFHEPVTLMVLDSVLPSITPAKPPADESDAVAATAPPDASAEARPGEDASVFASTEAGGAGVAEGAAARNYFGYFTLTEVIIMIFGTLVAALIIFLVLEYL